MLRAASLCIHRDPHARPRMSQVRLERTFDGFNLHGRLADELLILFVADMESRLSAYWKVT